MFTFTFTSLLFYYFRRAVNNTGFDITKSCVICWLSNSYIHLQKYNIRIRISLSDSNPICVNLNILFSCSRVKR